MSGQVAATMDSVDDGLWEDILGHVRVHWPDLARGWFNQLVPVSLKHGVLTIQPSNAAQRHYLKEHCTKALTDAAQATTGRLISVWVAPPPEDLSGASSPFGEDDAKLILNRDYVFDNFVVGPCNRLGHAACVGASEAPGRTYNPLFVHGPVGLGKTHLLQAACQRVLDQRPDASVMFLSCETFTNHFFGAVESGALHEFRYRYRHLDMLVIDDIQFLTGRERSQEEFFHTFNTLYQAGGQIILSADASPHELPRLPERLVSRFNWGLVVRIDPPCLETRMAIIRKKAKLRCIEIPDDVTYFLASKINSNIRELEGTIVKVDAVSQQYDGVINMTIAREALGVEQENRGREITIAEIMTAVTRRYRLRPADLQSQRRTKSISFGRQVCMYLARQLTQLSLSEIGAFFGRRDHTTVLHACRTIDEQYERDEELTRSVNQLTAELRRP